MVLLELLVGFTVSPKAIEVKVEVLTQRKQSRSYMVEKIPVKEVQSREDTRINTVERLYA